MDKNSKIHSIDNSELLESDLDKDPIKQFNKWFKEALSFNVPEADAITLATSTQDGRPSTRIVLLKVVTETGFIFFSNYQSRKGLEIEQNPFGAINIFWKEIKRQVRVEGIIERIDGKFSDKYFTSRPRGSQIGAWASPQSNKIANREILDQRAKELEIKFKDREIPRPKQWGGYSLIPELIEFWQYRQNRMHDRIQYTLNKDGKWLMERLAP